MFTLGSNKIGDKSLYFVIEEGQANLGDFNKAIAMIDLAVYTGADAIEFQIFRAGDLYVAGEKGYHLYRKRELEYTQINDLIFYAKEKNIDFIAVPLSHRIIDKLVDFGCSAFNINASDLTNPYIIDAVSESTVPFFLSIPLAEENEIDWAINRIMQRNASSYAILHGQHTMASGGGGVNIAHTSLGYIAVLKQKHNVPVGFVDHTPALWMPAVAVASGADIISKHLAINRADKGPDWEVCLEGEEMKTAIEIARKTRDSLNASSKVLAPGEYTDRSAMRRSVVAERNIAKGEVLKLEDINFKRPGSGVSPHQFDQIIGKIADRDIAKDEQILFEHLREDI